MISSSARMRCSSITPPLFAADPSAGGARRVLAPVRGQRRRERLQNLCLFGGRKGGEQLAEPLSNLFGLPERRLQSLLALALVGPRPDATLVREELLHGVKRVGGGRSLFERG